MKTNHQRHFKDRRDPGAVFRNYCAGGSQAICPLSDRVIGACANSGDHANGKRGIVRDVAGAKKYVRSRTRFHENTATRKLARAFDAAEA